MHLQSRGKSFPKINVKKPLLRQGALIWFKVGSMRSGLLWDFSEAKRYYTDGLQTDPDPQLEWLGEGFPNSMNLLQYSPSWRYYHVCCFLLQHNICKWITCNCVVLFLFFSIGHYQGGMVSSFDYCLFSWGSQSVHEFCSGWSLWSNCKKVEDFNLPWQICTTGCCGSSKGEKNIKITLTIFKTHFIAF